MGFLDAPKMDVPYCHPVAGSADFGWVSVFPAHSQHQPITLAAGSRTLPKPTNNVP